MTSAHDDDYEQLPTLFAEMAALPADDPERDRLRTQIIETCLPIADHIAARYRGRGQTHEDLLQAASVGLVSAVNRFDLHKGNDFLAYAVPTMMGEVRKHFRDKGWSIRVPRSLQEKHLALNRAQSLLPQSLGRDPTIPELAAEIGVDPSEIGQIVAASDAYRSTSLDVETFKDGILVGDTLGDFDAAIEAVDNHETLRSALLALPERERTIVLYRFFGEMTQTEIAQKVGLSQMHVSRLLSRSLKALRGEIGDITS